MQNFKLIGAWMKQKNGLTLWFLESICLVGATCSIRRRPIQLTAGPSKEESVIDVTINKFPSLFLSPFHSFIDALSLSRLKSWWKMSFTEAQELFSLFFAVYFALIIDRSHEMYKPWDTYNAWKGKSHNIKRLLTAWIILFIVPLLHFSILFVLLGFIDVRFDMTIGGILNVASIGLGSFFEFGYFRIYEAFLHRYSKSFFTDEERIQKKRLIRPDFWAHFIPGILYVILSALLVLLAVYH